MLLFFTDLNCTLTLDLIINFVKIKNVTIDVPVKRLMDNTLTATDCAVKCASLKDCLSFEITRDKKCYWLENSAALSDHIKITPNCDYYQLVKRNYALYSIICSEI